MKIRANIKYYSRNMNKLNFDFSYFYILHKNYLQTIIQPSNDFLCWLIGFSEAEGSFIVNNRGDLSFVITQSTNDIYILHYIQNILGFGKVIAQSSLTSRFVTQNKKEIEILISLFNGNLVLPTRKIKLKFFIENFNIWVTKGKIRLNTVTYMDTFLFPTLNNSWISGFTDGEGCFACSILNKKGFTFNFNISQKGEKNKIILHKFCELFNAGRVSQHHVNDIYEYRINGLRNCANIFNYFDKYILLTKKSLSYILWKQIHKNLLNKDHLYPEKILKLKEKVKLINKK